MEQSLNEQKFVLIRSLTTFRWNVLRHFAPPSCKLDQTTLDINELQRVQFSDPSYFPGVFSWFLFLLYLHKCFLESH